MSQPRQVKTSTALQRKPEITKSYLVVHKTITIAQNVSPQVWTYEWKVVEKEKLGTVQKIKWLIQQLCHMKTY